MIPAFIYGSTSRDADLEDCADSADRRNDPDQAIYSEKVTMPETDYVDEERRWHVGNVPART